MLRNNAGIVAGFFFFVFSIVFLIVSFDYSYMDNGSPGPGFMPFWISALMVVLSILYIVESVKHHISFKEVLPSKHALKKMGAVLLAIIVFICIAETAGFIIASTIMMFMLLWREYKWWLNVVISAGISLLFFWIFVVLLSIPLPVNGLGW